MPHVIYCKQPVRSQTKDLFTKTFYECVFRDRARICDAYFTTINRIKSDKNSQLSEDSSNF